jgi:hypothetical protein
VVLGFDWLVKDKKEDDAEPVYMHSSKIGVFDAARLLAPDGKPTRTVDISGLPDYRRDRDEQKPASKQEEIK